jgi:exosortase
MSSSSHSKNPNTIRRVANRQLQRRHVVLSDGNGLAQGTSSILRAIGLVLAVITTWAYWPVIVQMFKDWQNDDNYSAGQLVPLVAFFLVWREWKTLKSCTQKPCWVAGIILLVLAQAARTYGLLFMFESAERYALVLTIAALVLMVAGWQVFRRAGWILLFLFLMVPLPGKIHNLISNPLQRFATNGSVFLMEAIGINVSQQGNLMILNDNTPLAVAEACSGLRMLMAFIIVVTFIVLMVKKPRWQKTVLFCSSIPIAIIANIIRILVTALLMMYASEELAQKFFHDFAGLVMMPIAVMIVIGEIKLMDKLVLPDEEH